MRNTVCAIYCKVLIIQPNSDLDRRTPLKSDVQRSSCRWSSVWSKGSRAVVWSNGRAVVSGERKSLIIDRRSSLQARNLLSLCRLSLSSLSLASLSRLSFSCRVWSKGAGSFLQYRGTSPIRKCPPPPGKPQGHWTQAYGMVRGECIFL